MIIVILQQYLCENYNIEKLKGIISPIIPFFFPPENRMEKRRVIVNAIVHIKMIYRHGPP